MDIKNSNIYNVEELLNCNYVNKINTITLNEEITFDNITKIMNKIPEFINLEKIHLLNVSEKVFHDADFSNICNLNNIKVIYIKYDDYSSYNIKTIITSKDTIIIKLHKIFLDIHDIKNFDYPVVKIMNIKDDVFLQLKYILENISQNTNIIELFFDDNPHAKTDEENIYKLFNNLSVGLEKLTITYFKYPNDKYSSLIKKPFGCTINIKYCDKNYFNY